MGVRVDAGERGAHRKLTLDSEGQWSQVCPEWKLEGSVCPTSLLRGSGVPRGSSAGSAEKVFKDS